MIKQTKHKIPRKGYVMEDGSTVYGLKISIEILERADRVAQGLSKDVKRFPSGQAGRADAVRLAIVLGLDELEKTLQSQKLWGSIRKAKK